MTTSKPKRMLFVCVDNANRNQMAHFTQQPLPHFTDLSYQTTLVGQVWPRASPGLP
jgi:hypothetical protein